MLPAITFRFVIPGAHNAVDPAGQPPSASSSALDEPEGQAESNGAFQLPPETQFQAEQLQEEVHGRLGSVAGAVPVTIDGISARFPSLGTELIASAVQAHQQLRQEQPGHVLLALNLCEATALHAYTDSFYLDMNTQLRECGSGRYPPADQLIADLCAGLEKIQALNKPGATVSKVYRGQNADVLSDMVRGSLLVDPGFLSTTRCADQADSFSSSNRQVVFSDQGVDVVELSASAEEQEVLFPPGTPFDILFSHQLPRARIRQVLSDSRLPESTGKKYEQDLAGRDF